MAIGRGAARPHQRDHVVVVRRLRRPDLLAVELPAVADRLGAGPHTREVGPGTGFTHADAEEDLAAADARKVEGTLLLRPVAQDKRGALTIRDPVRGDRRAGGEQFFGNDEAGERTAIMAAIARRQGEADHARGTEPPAELRIEPHPGSRPPIDRHVGHRRGDQRTDGWAKRLVLIGDVG